MKNWLGKFWLLRLVLWLLAAVLCFVIWPAAVWDVLPRERLNVYSQHFEDRYPYVGNPVLLVGKGVEAWDWKTGRRWRVPVSGDPSALIDVVSDGVTHAVAELDWERGIVVTDVMPPHEQRIYPLPEDWEGGQLVMIDSRMKFAVVGQYQGDGMAVHVQELATAKVVDTKTKIDQAFTLGNGDLELTQLEEVSSPSPDIISKATRWKLASDGQLVPSEAAPTTAQPEGNPAAAMYAMTSSDGRYEVSRTLDLPLVIRERSSGRVLHSPSLSNVDITDVAFSADGKYLLVGNAFTNFQVFDLETETLVAEDHRVQRRWWRSNILTVAFAIPSLLALALTLRTPSFERLACDYLLASVFLDSLVAAIVLGTEVLPGGFGISGATMAIGVYWAFGPQPFWKRLICGVAGIAVMFGLLSGIVGWTNEDDPNSENLVLTLTSLIFVPTVCGLAAWLITVPLGWRIAREEPSRGPARFQFGISTICLAIAIAAVIFAMMQRLTATVAVFMETQLEITAAAGAIMAVLILFYIATVWLLLWLWFRRHTWFSLFLAVASLAVLSGLQLLGLAVVRLVFQLRGLTAATLALTVYETWFTLAPLLFQCAWFSYALWLARRHGYGWVRAGKSAPAVDGSVEVAGAG